MLRAPGSTRCSAYKQNLGSLTHGRNGQSEATIGFAGWSSFSSVTQTFDMLFCVSHQPILMGIQATIFKAGTYVVPDVISSSHGLASSILDFGAVRVALVGRNGGFFGER
jgi:hypothetical protein